MNNTTPLISVIVPLYNVEKYINQCIDNILAQTYSNFELLLINDGSSDKSGEICDEYALKDSRIKVFYKENGGVSSARNFGLDKAQGDWITFIDSDDTISLEYFAEISKVINKSDDIELIHVNCVNYEFTYDRTKNYQLKHNFLKQEYTVDEISEYLKCIDLNLGAWGYMYRKKLIRKYKIYFDINNASYEDTMFALHYVSIITNKLSILSNVCYNYIHQDNHLNGTSEFSREKHGKEMIQSAERGVSILKTMCNLTPEVFNLGICKMQSIHLYGLFTIYAKRQQGSREDRQRLIKDYREKSCYNSKRIVLKHRIFHYLIQMKFNFSLKDLVLIKLLSLYNKI